MSAVKSRRERYSEATRAALLAAATRRFARDGFGATSLEDVAADIEATRGAVYHHFTSKKALFQAVLTEVEDAVMTRVAAMAITADDPWDGALAALDAFLDACLDEIYGRIVWREGPIALGWAQWHQVEEQHAYGLVERMLTTLAERGLLRPLPLTTTTRVVFSLLGSAGMDIADADPADRGRLRAEYGEVVRAMVGGLRTDPTVR